MGFICPDSKHEVNNLEENYSCKLYCFLLTNILHDDMIIVVISDILLNNTIVNISIFCFLKGAFKVFKSYV